MVFLTLWTWEISKLPGQSVEVKCVSHFPLTLSYFSNSFLSSVEAFRPIGETLIIPRLNSMNVPLGFSSIHGSNVV